jgi:hypothetical protein
MTLEPRSDRYIESLRNDFPTVEDEERIRRRLLAAGMGVTALVATPSTAAASATVVKAGVFSALSLRFASLPLIGQLGLVTATTAVLATGPVVVATTLREKPAVYRPAEQTSERPRAFIAPGSQARETNPLERNAPATDLNGPKPVQEAPVASRLDASPANALPQTSTKLRRDEPVDTNLSSLADETKLIDEALSLIRQNRFEQSAVLLRTHAERFPNGHLTLERQRAERKLLDAKQRLSP